MLRLAILRLLILLATLPILALGAGCKSRATPPPLRDGQCVVSEYVGDRPSLSRCTWSGATWTCVLDGQGKNTCTVISIPTPPIAEAR